MMKLGRSVFAAEMNSLSRLRGSEASKARSRGWGGGSTENAMRFAKSGPHPPHSASAATSPASGRGELNGVPTDSTDDHPAVDFRARAFSSRLCDPDRRTCFVSFESRSGEPPSGNPGGSWFCVFSSLACCRRPPHWQARSEEPLPATSQGRPVSKAGSQICSCASFRNVSRLLASTCHTASDQTFRGGHINVRSWCIFPERAEVCLKCAGFNSLRQRPSGPDLRPSEGTDFGIWHSGRPGSGEFSRVS
jgi:hypothetical protein